MDQPTLVLVRLDILAATVNSAHVAQLHVKMAELVKSVQRVGIPAHVQLDTRVMIVKSRRAHQILVSMDQHASSMEPAIHAHVKMDILELIVKLLLAQQHHVKMKEHAPLMVPVMLACVQMAFPAPIVK